MKLLTCNGRELEVRDVGPVVYRLLAGDVPIKLHGRFVLDDDAARDLLRELREAGARNFGIGAQFVPAAVGVSQLCCKQPRDHAAVEVENL